MADLQEIFSRLKASGTFAATPVAQNSPAPPFPQNTNYQPPTVSSTVASTPRQTPEPSGSSILSPKIAPQPQDARSASLLNLLRFNTQTPTQSSPLSALHNVSGDKVSSGGDSTNVGSSALSLPKELGQRHATSPGPDTQALLLNLLNKPAAVTKHASSSQNGTRGVSGATTIPAGPPSPSPERHAREETPARIFGSTASRETTPFEAPTQSNGNGLFTYKNPFEELSASTPKIGTPRPTEKTASLGLDVSKTRPQQPEVNFGKEETPRPVSGAGVKTESAEVPESWQTAQLEKDPAITTVYNFPLRPFVSLHVDSTIAASKAFRKESMMDIVRLKKDFDQVDRTLVAASSNHIAYGIAKGGGYRIIRQDSGRDQQVFKSNQERIFHIQVQKASTETGADIILAAGVHGTVFWSSATVAESDNFSEESPDRSGFILPPINTPDENTSGAPVKTRTKISSQNTDLFAISRGKSIHLLAPSAVLASAHLDAKTRIVDSPKHFADRTVKISVGKACKDFAFSGDDTVIASLDKTGRIKFWDIKEASHSARAPGKVQLEVKFPPLMTLVANTSSEKVSPTSILFLDKERPCVKGVALRYLLVGFKQNHVLQLWDIGLGKPVQELHLPHDNDSDAICSISYHPKSGIISVAHPTRNSIFFIHLSAPRYNIPNLEQAKYISMVASEDRSLPKPEATAIMSGIRELSFGSKGLLRSVDMLSSPAAVPDSTGNQVLFELYAMHSTGVTFISIDRSDLGWTSDNKIISGVDAEKAKLVRIGPLTAPSSSLDELADTASEVAKSSKGQDLPAPVPSKPNAPATTLEDVVKSIEEPEIMPAASQLPKQSKAPIGVVSAPQNGTTASSALPVQPSPVPIIHKTSDLVDRTRQPEVNGTTKSTSDGNFTVLAGTIASEFEKLYRRIDDDRRDQDDTANKRQSTVLSLVSSTLTENVEKSLAKIVSSSMQAELLPAVSDVFATLVERQLPTQLHSAVAQALPLEVRAALPAAVSAALKDEQTSRALSGPLSAHVSQKVLETMESVVRKTIAPTIAQSIAVSVTNAQAEATARMALERAEDAVKIDALTSLVYGLTDTLQRLTGTVAGLQDQIAGLSGAGASDLHKSGALSDAGSVRLAASIEDEELTTITALMTDSRFEDGTIKWLQSSRQALLFDELFVRINPQYLQKLSPLVKLSVSAAVSSSFENNVDVRLDWLSIILATTDLQDPEIVDVAPKLLAVLLGRLQGAYIDLAEADVAAPALRKLSELCRRIPGLIGGIAA